MSDTKTTDWFDWARQKIERGKEDAKRFKKLYSVRARRVVREAIDEAEVSNANSISADHLLISLVKNTDPGLRALPAELRLNLETLRAESLAERGGAAASQKPGFSPLMSRIIANARKEADSLGQVCVEPEHLLLALLAESEGIAARILRRHSVDREAMRRMIKDVLVKK